MCSNPVLNSLSSTDLKKLLSNARRRIEDSKSFIREKRFEKSTAKLAGNHRLVKELTASIREIGYSSYNQARQEYEELQEIYQKKLDEEKNARKIGRALRKEEKEKENEKLDEEVVPKVLEKLSRRKNQHPGSQRGFDLETFGDEEDKEPEIGDISDKEVQNILILERLLDLEEEFA